MALMNFVAPQNRESAIDRLAKVLGIVNAGASTAANIYGIKKGMDENSRAEADQARQVEAYKLKQAEENATTGPMFDFVNEAGLKYAPGTKAKDIKPLYEFAVKKREMDLQHKGKLGEISATGYQARLTDAAKHKNENGLTGDAARLAKLPNEARSRYDNVVMASKALNDMNAALDQGQDRYSIVGDNDFTAALGRFKEAVGRMQSGGQIGQAEGKDFINLVRSMGDDVPMTKKKLATVKTEMQSRYKSLGFDPAANPDIALSFDPRAIPGAQGPALIENANADKGAKFSAQDLAAAEAVRIELSRNPNNPDMQMTKRLLESRGLKF